MARRWTRLEECLVLLNYLHHQFGAKNFLDLKQKLAVDNLTEGYAADGRSFLALRLMGLKDGHIQPHALQQYDDNIKRHLDSINAARPAANQITLKYFQHLALFYTEHFLRRAWLDEANFLAELNRYLAGHVNHVVTNPADHFPPFQNGDLTKLAYWMATGSGKTLLLHLNYHQILHYTALANRAPYDSILLITPNSGLSAQHIEEFKQSGIPAERFQNSGLALAQANTVQVIEIHKISPKDAGPNTVHVDSFEGNNLVFVDEGHRGASGEVWFDIRNRLAAQGFTFEYSATFGEALNGGSKDTDYQARQSYGKSVVFDYSYKYFHGDGYGKDYTILNLPKKYDDQRHGHTLLLANLLAFYQQMRMYDDLGRTLRDYLLERPLLIFVGHTVTTGKTTSQLNQEDKTSLSDVLELVLFLQQVATNASNWATDTLAAILSGNTPLTDDGGHDLFEERFEYLKSLRLSSSTLYADMLQRLFHVGSPGSLHLANIKNAAGEIGLRVGVSDQYFGVINIGDDANFLKLAEEAQRGLFMAEEALRGSLFDGIDAITSPVTMLLGAKKFIEGWSSWRVSGMGLLNVGRSEGSEIIQMFGRGVRLKGYQFSLKRSTTLGGAHPPHLNTLETLNIFSIHGDYLAQFKNALDREGIIEGFEEIPVPVEYPLYHSTEQRFGGNGAHHTLYTVRVKGDLDFAGQPAFPLEAVSSHTVRPTIDLRPTVQALTSLENDAAPLSDPSPQKLEAHHLALLNWPTITAEMLAWKRQRGYRNMAITQAALQAVLNPASDCYELRAPDDYLRLTTFESIPRLQEIALTILKQYADRFYKEARKAWERPQLEYYPLTTDDNNLKLEELRTGQRGYIVKVNRKNYDLIKKINDLITAGRDMYQKDVGDLQNIHFDRHLYLPLFTSTHFNAAGQVSAGDPDLKFVPTGLVESETWFVHRLRDFLTTNPTYLGQRHLYLLRNLSRGKGIGFFEADNFYPDFILWQFDGDKQHIIFVDPKGLGHIWNGFENEKVQLYNTIKGIQARIGDPNVTLDSYIISEKSFAEVQPTFGTRSHTRAEFHAHHILFKDDEDLVEMLLISSEKKEGLREDFS
jgi:hypothetical protein